MKNVPQLVARDKARARLREESRLEKKKRNYLLQENDRLQRENEAILKLRDRVRVTPIKPRAPRGKHEACPVIVWSDQHVDERIRPDEVNGVNFYDVPEARRRFENTVKNTLKLLEIVQRDSVITRAVLALLGDAISGNIHEENATTASLRPMDAILEAQSLIASGIRSLLDATKLEYTIVCKVGNHSRITKPQYNAMEAEHSLEFFMYHNLKNHFSKESRLTFIIESSYLTYLPIYNDVLRFHHGHNIKYQGGVGGLTIPVRKAIAEWNKQRVATLDVFGHWHQFFDGGNFISNGSMIGYNAYAVAIKAGYEPPKQAFFLIDKERGKSVVAPIWVT